MIAKSALDSAKNNQVCVCWMFDQGIRFWKNISVTVISNVSRYENVLKSSRKEKTLKMIYSYSYFYSINHVSF